MSKRSSSVAVVLAAALLSACSSSGGDSGSASASAGKPAKTAEAPSASAPPSASTPPPPADPPILAGVKAGVWKDPVSKADVKLVDMPMDKCYGFKGYSVKAPEGSKLETLVGARACSVAFPSDPKVEFGILVMTDEIKVQWYDKAKIENVTKKHIDEPEAFLYERDWKGKPQLIGWVERPVGPHKTRCNVYTHSSKGKVEFDLDAERAFIELCRSLTYTEPPKK